MNDDFIYVMIGGGLVLCLIFLYFLPSYVAFR